VRGSPSPCVERRAGEEGEKKEELGAVVLYLHPPLSAHRGEKEKRGKGTQSTTVKKEKK